MVSRRRVEVDDDVVLDEVMVVVVVVLFLERLWGKAWLLWCCLAEPSMIQNQKTESKLMSRRNGAAGWRLLRAALQCWVCEGSNLVAPFQMVVKRRKPRC